jgi:tape measure domain-containing protein
MIDRKEIELAIRAQFKGQADINKVTDKIDELGKAIDHQADAAKRGVGSMNDLRAATRDLKEEQARLTDIAEDLGRMQRLTETIAKQEERVRKAAKAYDDLRTKLAGQNEVTDAQQQRLTKLAAASERAQAALTRQRDQWLTLGDVLRKAGVDTTNLAAAEDRLRTSAALLGAAYAKGQSALNEFDSSARHAAGSVSTLARASADLRPRVVSLSEALAGSTVRPLVGQLTALIAAYAGVHAAVSQAGKSIESFNAREGVKNQLSLSVGTSKQAIDEEYAYVKAQADRIGIEFETAAKGYAKFAAAAALAGRSRQEIRYIFEAFSEVARVANLSKDDLNGVFKALEQIISKGKIQAEELRGQLGDRLFGAFQIAAQALKDTYPDLDKALKDGVVTSNQLIAIAEKYRETVGGQLAQATNSLAANQARLNNALADFRLAVADGGFADAYLRLLERLTAFLRSADGQAFAKDVSAALAAVADALVFVLGHLAELKLGVATLAGLWAAMKLKSVTGDFVDLAKAIRGAAGSTSMLTKAFSALSAFIVGWNIGTYLYDKFEIVRKAGAVLVVSYELAWSKIKFGAMELFEELPRFASNAFALLINTATTGMRQFLTILERGARALGLTGLADNLAKALDTITLKLNDGISSRVAQIRKDAADDLKRIRAIGESMLEETAAKPAVAAKVAAEPTASPGIRAGKAEPTEAEIAKRQRAIDAITKAIEIIDAKIDRAQTDTLAKQLEVIDIEYLALKRRIKTVGGTEARDFLAQLDESVSQLKFQVTRKFNDKRLAEQNALLSKVEQAETAAGRKEKLDLDARLAAIATSYADTYRDIAEQRAKLEQNQLSTAPADEAKRRLDAAVLELQSLERVKFAREELTRLEARYADQVKLREGLLAAVRASTRRVRSMTLKPPGRSTPSRHPRFRRSSKRQRQRGNGPLPTAPSSPLRVTCDSSSLALTRQSRSSATSLRLSTPSKRRVPVQVLRRSAAGSAQCWTNWRRLHRAKRPWPMGSTTSPRRSAALRFSSFGTSC